MADQSPDIFESDQAFVGVVSTILLVTGVFSLAMILFCKVFAWGFCDMKWIPLFGGFDLGRSDLLAINLPLAMLILGIGLRLYTVFGWATCLILLWILAGSFSAIAWKLYQNLDELALRIAQNEINPENYPITESIIVNISFGILCVLGIFYLLTPSVRKLYWKSKPPTPPPTDT
jgi:hypothetical protein